MIFNMLGFDTCGFFGNAEDRKKVYKRAKQLSIQNLEQEDPYYIEVYETEDEKEELEEDKDFADFDEDN